MFEKRAPKSLVEIERLIAPAEVRQGNNPREFDAGLLELLTKAYREAAGNGRHSIPLNAEWIVNDAFFEVPRVEVDALDELMK